MLKSKKKKIIFLANCNRFVFPLAAFLIPALLTRFSGRGMGIMLLYLGISLVIFSAYNIIGALLKWKHIYCALQSMTRKKMTPDNIEWYEFGFADKYGAPLIFTALYIAMLILYFCGVS